MANAIFVFCKGLFSEAIPRLFKKLFSHEEKPPIVLKVGDNNCGNIYVFNGPVTLTQTALPPPKDDPPKKVLTS
jgi:hypothetical protein